MRVLLGSLALLALASCDPPPPQYPQYRYGNDPSQDPNPPPAYSNDPNAPPSTYPQPQAQPPPPGYTSTTPQPGYTTTVVPGYSGPPPQTPAGPSAPAMPPQPDGGPPPAMQSPSSIAAGQYTCWQVGMGGYVASTLVSVNLNPDGTYQVAGYKNAGGSYRTDTVSVFLTGGPLNGWIGAIGANAKGPLVRFRPDTPNNPGNEMHQGDHLCFLHF
ncbi:MAG TPA: hypothetical protein VGL61_12870 [Kofleriaceae bacterium]|jgi:hypothetical protein